MSLCPDVFDRIFLLSDRGSVRASQDQKGAHGYGIKERRVRRQKDDRKEIKI